MGIICVCREDRDRGEFVSSRAVWNELKTCSEDEVRQEGVTTNACISMYFRTEIELSRRGAEEEKPFSTKASKGISGDT